MPQKTIGELRVRSSFNPSGSGIVDQIKAKGIEMINLIDSIPTPAAVNNSVSEFMRLKALAMTEAEHATSDAVKAATLKSEDYL